MRIVYHSFHGRFSDNPRALHEALLGTDGLEHVWLAHEPHRAGFPDDVRTVDIETAEAVDALESADLVVSNTHVEVDWRKPAGTTYLQTWHGTPLKRIHYDVLWAPEGRLDRLDLDVAMWDVLVSPNAVSTPRLQRAFGFRGEVWETGYPRNDLLTAPEGCRRREEVRAALGLEPGTTAVLYAPTWRDDEWADRSRPRFPLGLDPAALADRLGPGHAVLVRSHGHMTGRLRVPEAAGVRDVSYHPDVRDLYLACDVLVTDYSSVMFDFAVTGKPMAFYAYDLDRFRDSVRGFYFDLEPVAPGPVVRTFEDLTDVLAEPDAVRRAYSGRYDRFRTTFCGLEDGHATARVLGRLAVLLPQLGDRLVAGDGPAAVCPAEDRVRRAAT